MSAANYPRGTDRHEIERIELREIHLPLVAPFETSFGRTTGAPHHPRQSLRRGTRRVGRMHGRENPFTTMKRPTRPGSSSATIAGPMVLGREIESPERSLRPDGAHPRQQDGARRGRDARSGTWKRDGRAIPLWQLLGGTQEEIACGVSIGLQETDAALLEKIETELAAGYQRIKIKIKPGRDVTWPGPCGRSFPTSR